MTTELRDDPAVDVLLELDENGEWTGTLALRMTMHSLLRLLVEGGEHMPARVLSASAQTVISWQKGKPAAIRLRFPIDRKEDA